MSDIEKLEKLRGSLKIEFSSVAFKTKPDGNIVASIRDIFNYNRTVMTMLRGALTMKSLVILEQPEGKGKTEEESFARCMQSIARVNRMQGLIRFLPKEGQDSSQIKPGAAYELVRRSHPAHDHKSLALLDFVYVEPSHEGFVNLDFDDYHSHVRAMRPLRLNPFGG